MEQTVAVTECARQSVSSSSLAMQALVQSMSAGTAGYCPGHLPLSRSFQVVSFLLMLRNLELTQDRTSTMNLTSRNWRICRRISVGSDSNVISSCCSEMSIFSRLFAVCSKSSSTDPILTVRLP